VDKAETMPVEQSSEPGRPHRPTLRLLVAVGVTTVVALLAAGVWAVGQAQYLNDYCTTRAPQPETATPEGIGGRPAYLDGLTTVRCEYDNLPAVTVTDPMPLLGALLLAACVLAVWVVVFRWVRRPAAN
jgi:hypothetical protein